MLWYWVLLVAVAFCAWAYGYAFGYISTMRKRFFSWPQGESRDMSISHAQWVREHLEKSKARR